LLQTNIILNVKSNCAEVLDPSHNVVKAASLTSSNQDVYSVLVQNLPKQGKLPTGSLSIHEQTNGHVLMAPGLEVHSLRVSLPLTPAASAPGISNTQATPAIEKEKFFDRSTAKLALQILNIIQRYGQNAFPFDVS
jgi:hypothetical protein